MVGCWEAVKLLPSDWMRWDQWQSTRLDNLCRQRFIWICPASTTAEGARGASRVCAEHAVMGEEEGF
jgi:hypothetical protein